MKHKLFLLTMTCIVLVIGLSLMSVPASATPADVYTIDWYTLDGGGVMSLQGGSYTLNGTIGQPDAGSLTSGSYRLNGGFWQSLDALRKLYLPLVLK